MSTISAILEQSTFSHSDLEHLLLCDGEDKRLLFEKAGAVKEFYVGNKVYFRGLIEFSNVCDKDCYYCGIRKSNQFVRRYNLTDSEILDAARFAHENKYGSVVLQSGENSSSFFADRITNLIAEIKKLTSSHK